MVGSNVSRNLIKVGFVSDAIPGCYHPAAVCRAAAQHYSYLRPSAIDLPESLPLPMTPGCSTDNDNRHEVTHG